MGMTVGLGFFDAYYEEMSDRKNALGFLVESGAVRLVRNVFYEDRFGRDVERSKILEARRVDGRVVVDVLDEEAASYVKHDVRTIFEKYDSYAAFPYAEADELGVWDTRDLAMSLLDKTRDRIEFPWGDAFSVHDIETSLACSFSHEQHDEVRIAAELHRLAQRHSMIVHAG